MIGVSIVPLVILLAHITPAVVWLDNLPPTAMWLDNLYFFIITVPPSAWKRDPVQFNPWAAETVYAGKSQTLLKLINVSEFISSGYM